MRRLSVMVALVVAMLSTATVVAATNVWYVSSDPTKGSDSNDGKSVDTPFLTVDKAMSKVANAVDVDEIRLLPGTYKTTEMSSGYIKYKTAQIAIIGHTGDRRDVLIDGGGTNRGLYSDTYSVSNRLVDENLKRNQRRIE